jgi:cytochrome c oxidase subunit 2
MFDFPFLPPSASQFAEELDYFYYTMWGLTFFFSIVVFAIVLWFVYRYRRGNTVNRSKPVHHSNVVEIAWSLPPLLLGLGMFFWAAKMYAREYKMPNDAMEIFVIGKQWMWHAQHSNGVRENNLLHVPVGKPVKLTLISQDVIHSYFIPAFRAKRDALPGRYNQMWFKPTKPGKYRLLCAEYCGTEHSLMGGWVIAMEPTEFENWLANGGDDKKPGRMSMVDRGKELYEQLACGSCHTGADTVRGPSLIAVSGKTVTFTNGSTAKADDEYLRESILKPNDRLTKGYQPTMPSYAEQLSEEQVLDLIAYIKTLGAGPNTSQPSKPAAAATRPASKPTTTGETEASAQPSTTAVSPAPEVKP